MNFLKKAGLLMFLSGLVSISHIEPKADGVTPAIVLLVLGVLAFLLDHKP